MAGVFTVIIDTFYRPALLKEAVEALFRQTYSNLEIILVNNAATPETVEYLHQVEREDRRVKLVHFSENQFSLADPMMMIDTCLNAGLQVARGDYVWYQADDDLIADDYAEKMVALFRDHPNCITAAGLPVGIDAQGNRLDHPERRTTNRRPRYMPGHELALAVAGGNRTLFSAPGTVFTIRREALIRAGGYHRCIEMSQLYGIVPFGDTGFDESALFYWRRHEGQLNKKLNEIGFLGIDEHFDLLHRWNLEARWREGFGNEAARLVVTSMTSGLCRSAANWCAANLVAFRLVAAWHILRKIWRQPVFWRFFPRQFLVRSARRAGELIRLAIPAPVRRLLKPLVRRLQTTT